MSEAVDGWLSVRGAKPALGSLSSAGGWLRKRISHRNPLQATMYVRFDAAGSGCRITAWSFVSVGMLVLLVLWLGLHGAGVIMGLSMMAWGGQEGLPPILLWSGETMLFTMAAAVFSRWMARDEHAFLLGLLTKELDGVQQADPRSRTGNPMVS